MITKEFRKLFTDQLTVAVLCLLLLLNMSFCAYTVHKQVDPEFVGAMKIADQAFQETPEEITASQKLYEEMEANYGKLMDEWSMYEMGIITETELTGPPESPDIPSTYVKDMNDYRLFQRYFAQIITDEQYQGTINEKADSVSQQMKQYKANGYDPRAYAYRLNIRFLDVYQNSAETIRLTGGYVYGWDMLFSTEYMGLFVFLAVIFIGSRLFVLERDTGMHLVVRATPKGHMHLAGSKIIAALLIACLLTVVFFGSAMLVIGLQIGFSSPWDSVQLIKDMIYCPFSLNMAECLGITMGMTALSALGLMLLTACLSLWLKQSLTSMLASAALVGGSFYFFVWGKIPFLKYVNWFTTVSVNELLGNWRSVRIIEHPISQLVVLPFLLVLLLAVCVIVSVAVWDDVGIGAVSPWRISLPRFIPAIKFKQRRIRKRSLKLSRYEFTKLLTTAAALGCVCLIGAKVYLSIDQYTGKLNYADEMKLLYMQEYEKLPLQETADAVSQRIARYEELTSKEYAEKMATIRLDGSLSAEEYAHYHAQVNDAMRHKNRLNAYLDEVEYLLEKEAQTGITSKPVLYVGYSQLMASEFEPILIMLLLLFFCGSLAKEYETSSINLLRTTKRGRAPVYFTKMAIAAGVSMALSIAFTALDAVLVFVRYDMSYLSSPLFTIPAYVNTVSEITIGEYLIFVAILRTVSYTCLGVLIAALSGVLRSEWLCAGSILLLFIPYLLTGIGLTVFEPFDLTLALSADRLYLYSTALGETGSLWFLVIFMAVWSAVAVSLSIVSYRKFCK